MTETAEIIAFILLGIVTLGAATAAASLRNLVHCGLTLALTFTGVAGFYLLLGAEFVGFVQLLVYVGAVAILIMFVILLSRPESAPGSPAPADSPGIRRIIPAIPGLAIAISVFAALVYSIVGSDSLRGPAPEAAVLSIESLGQSLVSSHLLPLQIAGVMLTAALIGGVLFAMKEDDQK